MVNNNLLSKHTNIKFNTFVSMHKFLEKENKWKKICLKDAWSLAPHCFMTILIRKFSKLNCKFIFPPKWDAEKIINNEIEIWYK